MCSTAESITGFQDLFTVWAAAGPKAMRRQGGRSCGSRYSSDPVL